MSGIYGTDTNYYSIADIHEDVSLHGTSTQEYEFLSGSNGQPMITWQSWIDNFLFNKPIIQQDDNSVLNAVNSQLKKDKLGNVSQDAPFSVYDALGKFPQLSKFKNLVDEVGYGKLKDFQFKVTLLAPINDFFDDILWYTYNIAYTKVALVETLRYHILPYLLLPYQLKDRKLRIRTDLDKRTLTTDWTKGKMSFINPLNYDDDTSPNKLFPRNNWEVKCLGIIRCDNGIIYVIDRPLLFPTNTTGTN